MKIKSYDKLRPVELTWLDSEAIEAGWQRIEDYRANLSSGGDFKSTGYLVGWTKKKVMLALSASESGDSICNTMIIPRVAVTHVKFLDKKSKKSSKVED